MATNECKPAVHRGRNLDLILRWKKMPQQQLADLIGKHQTQISDLINDPNADIEVLKEISEKLDVPLDFFTSFDMGEAVKSYNVSNNTFNAEGSIGQSINAEGSIGQNNGENIETQINNPLEDVHKVYKILLDEKDSTIALLKEQLAKK